CGARLDDSARFCTSCGRPIGAGHDSAGDAAAGQQGAESSQRETNPRFATAPRRLRRIVAQKKIAGVCAGFAEYFDTDLTLMRVIWVALLLLPPHLGLIAYII